jgi:hypothetical protein
MRNVLINPPWRIGLYIAKLLISLMLRLYNTEAHRDEFELCTESSKHLAAHELARNDAAEILTSSDILRKSK